MSISPFRWSMTAVGEPMVKSEFELITPGAGEVVVEVAGCGVCHTDLGYYYDGVRFNHAPPLTLGHEISGRVVTVGGRRGSVAGKGGTDTGCYPVRGVRIVSIRTWHHLS